MGSKNADAWSTTAVPDANSWNANAATAIMARCPCAEATHPPSSCKTAPAVGRTGSPLAGGLGLLGRDRSDKLGGDPEHPHEAARAFGMRPVRRTTPLSLSQ